MNKPVIYPDQSLLPRLRRRSLYAALLITGSMQVSAFLFLWIPAFLPVLPYTGTLFDGLIAPIAIAALALYVVVLILAIVGFVLGSRRVRIVAAILSAVLLAELAWQIVVNILITSSQSTF